MSAETHLRTRNGSPTDRARADRRRWWPLICVVTGVLTVTAAAIVGFVSLRSIGAGRLDTVRLGQTITFDPAGSDRAIIYVTRGLDAPAQCQVEALSGRFVSLHNATPYNVSSRYDMEGAFGFNPRADASYRVTCRAPDQQGSFAVVGYSLSAQRAAFTVGVVGGALVVGGVAGWFWMHRRSQR